MTHTLCEAERQVQYTSWAALVQLEGQSCVVLLTLSLSHFSAAEALGGSSQVKQAVFKRLSSYPECFILTSLWMMSQL